MVIFSVERDWSGTQVVIAALWLVLVGLSIDLLDKEGLYEDSKECTVEEDIALNQLYACFMIGHEAAAWQYLWDAECGL